MLGLLIFLAVLFSWSAAAQAVNTTPSPRDQNYVLFGSKQKNDPSQVRTLRGTVLDTTGKPISDATVQLKERPDGKIRTVTSGRDGSFRFDDLSLTQDYGVEAAYKGATSLRRTISQYDARKAITVELRLEKRKGSGTP